MSSGCAGPDWLRKGIVAVGGMLRSVLYCEDCRCHGPIFSSTLICAGPGAIDDRGPGATDDRGRDSNVAT